MCLFKISLLFCRSWVIFSSMETFTQPFLVVCSALVVICSLADSAKHFLSTLHWQFLCFSCCFNLSHWLVNLLSYENSISLHVFTQAVADSNKWLAISFKRYVFGLLAFCYLSCMFLYSQLEIFFCFCRSGLRSLQNNLYICQPNFSGHLATVFVGYYWSQFADLHAAFLMQSFISVISSDVRFSLAHFKHSMPSLLIHFLLEM